MDECVDACARLEYFIIVSDKKYCYGACPDDHPLHVTNSRECRACPDKTPYWTGTECAQVCPETMPVADPDNICRPCMGEVPYWDPTTSACVGECVLGTESAGSKVCSVCSTN